MLLRGELQKDAKKKSNLEDFESVFHSKSESMPFKQCKNLNNKISCKIIKTYKTKTPSTTWNSDEKDLQHLKLFWFNNNK